jgi:periplasmic divalent cation tolerance protein
VTSEDDAYEVVITAPDAEWLTDFVKSLVETRLCASAHIFSPIRSIYHWQEEVHDTTETRVALHTLYRHVSQIIERTNHEHPYIVPCVAALPIVDGNPAYIQWIKDETNLSF